MNQKPRFKHLRFKTEAEFKEWLDKRTDKIISFKDNGQDLLEIHIHHTGEIIHCNAQSGIWNGKEVMVSELEAGKNLKLWDNDKRDWRVMDFVVESIKQHKPAKVLKVAPVSKRGKGSSYAMKDAHLLKTHNR